MPKLSKPITRSVDRLPGMFTGPSAWLGKEMALAEDLWLYQLGEQGISDLEAAAGHFLQSPGLNVGEITAENFPLATLGTHIAQLMQKLRRSCAGWLTW